MLLFCKLLNNLLSLLQIHMETESDDLVQLKWDNFGNSMIASFKKFHGEEKFCDVTLWTEKESFKCHQVILSASSSFFERILSRHQGTSHASVYLHGISSKSLRSLLIFMYEAELTISQEDIPELLHVASVLEVKGLCKMGDDGDNVTSDQEKSEDHQSTTDINRNPTHLLSPFITLGGLDDREYAKDSDSSKCQRENPSVKEKHEIPSSRRDNSKDVDQLYTSERRTVGMTGHSQGQEGMTVTEYQCLLCAYNTTGGRWMMRNHMSNVHVNERVSCDICGRSLKNIRTLKVHLIKCRRKQETSLSCQNNPLSLLKTASDEEVNSDDRDKRNSLISSNTPVSLLKTIKKENVIDDSNDVDVGEKRNTPAPMETNATPVKQEGDRKRKLSEQVSAPTNPAVEEMEKEEGKRKAEKKAKKKAKKDAEEAANTTANTTLNKTHQDVNGEGDSEVKKKKKKKMRNKS